jgi:ornithine carbamoyltransferase
MALPDRAVFNGAAPGGGTFHFGVMLVTSAARHFLDIGDLPGAELRRMIETARTMKLALKAGRGSERPLAGKTLAMIFDRPSTRTRVSFDVGMRQLGGEAILLTATEMQLGRGESIADTARVLARYVDAILIRVLEPETLHEFARHSTVPVINGLTRLSHPCQVMADVMTFEEHRGPIRGRTVAWSGDANNVLTSWMHAAERLGFRLNIATPPELAPRSELIEWAGAKGAAIEIGHDPEQAVKDADCIVTDTWVSMGDQDGKRRRNLLKLYQVDARLMGNARPEAIFMHCLPAHRGEEVTPEVIDGPQSVIFDEAENRLHAQKGILAWCLQTNTR